MFMHMNSTKYIFLNFLNFYRCVNAFDEELLQTFLRALQNYAKIYSINNIVLFK